MWSNVEILLEHLGFQETLDKHSTHQQPFSTTDKFLSANYEPQLKYIDMNSLLSSSPLPLTLPLKQVYT